MDFEQQIRNRRIEQGNQMGKSLGYTPKNDIEKGRSLPVGTIKKRPNGNFIKTPTGWKYHSSKSSIQKNEKVNATRDSKVEYSTAYGDGKYSSKMKAEGAKSHKTKPTNYTVLQMNDGKFFVTTNNRAKKFIDQGDAKRIESSKMPAVGSSVHIGDMKRNEKLRAADALGIKNPSQYTPAQLQKKLVEANIDKQISEFKRNRNQKDSKTLPQSIVSDIQNVIGEDYDAKTINKVVEALHSEWTTNALKVKQQPTQSMQQTAYGMKISNLQGGVPLKRFGITGDKLDDVMYGVLQVFNEYEGGDKIFDHLE